MTAEISGLPCCHQDTHHEGLHKLRGSHRECEWSSDEVRGLCLCTGGFTAAFLDEAFGLLFYSLRQHGLLPFISPAFTAHLDVSFKKVTSCPSEHHTCVEAHCPPCKESLCICIYNCKGGLTVTTWAVLAILVLQ